MILPSSSDPGVTDLLDREAIRDCLVRYCHGVDRCDIESIRSAFWPDAIDDHAPFFQGTAWELAELAVKVQSKRDQSAHHVTNVMIRVEGSSAKVLAYNFAYSRVRPEKAGKPPYDMLMGGRYLDRFEKRDGEWRIAYRKTIVDWFRKFDDSSDWSRGLFGRPHEMGGKYPVDESAGFLGEQFR